MPAIRNMGFPAVEDALGLILHRLFPILWVDRFPLGRSIICNPVENFGRVHSPQYGNTRVNRTLNLPETGMTRQGIESSTCRPNFLLHRLDQSRSMGSAPQTGAARHGQQIHVGRNLHISHASLESRGNAIPLGSLINHGYVSDHRIPVRPVVHV